MDERDERSGHSADRRASDGDGPNLITTEGVNERGTDEEATGRAPSAPTSDRPGTRDADAAGAAAPGDEPMLAGAPEPNEPA